MVKQFEFMVHEKTIAHEGIVVLEGDYDIRGECGV